MANKNEIAQLILKCQQYDRIAQKQLYLLFADDVMRLALRYAKDKSSARDLVHDTFLKVFRRIHQYKIEKGRIKSWISRILINTAVDNYHRQKRVTFIPEENALATASEDISIVQSLEAEDILNLLQQLPEGARMVFNLNIIEGYKHSEIGEMLGISASASRSQLTRAKHLMRKLIGQIYNYDHLFNDRKTG